MGYFQYDGSTKTDIEDRVLAHLQIVIGAKLRRSESFYFTWKEDVSLGSGRTTVWIHAGAGLKFKFHGSRQPAINPAWLTAFTMTANSATGLYVVPEPADDHVVRERESMLVG